jgi:DNA-directed RNA polymerase sigma subunit (sigma70/sigma32)
VAATGTGELLLLSVDTTPAKAAPTAGDAARVLVADFVNATSEIPDDGNDIEEHLEFSEDEPAWRLNGLEPPQRGDRDSTLNSDERQQVLMNSLLATLSDDEAGILRLRFGLTDGQARTDDEIALVYGVDAQQIRESESQATRKLRDAHGHMDSMLATLSDDEAGIIRLRFGLTDWQPRSYDEIAPIYGLDPQQIRNIELQAHRKLWDAHGHDELLVQFETRLQP